MTSVMTEAPALFSTLASDPDMGELVELFVDELPGRIASLQAALNSADIDALARGAHQLKGAAGSYGFDVLTPALKFLEDQARGGATSENLQHSLSAVVELCGRVRCGLPQ